MGFRDAPLNAAQLEVLAWIRDGCPDGVYEDWSHRITARALHNRGLAEVQGHGASWSASLTDDGAHYLEHGEYSQPPEGSTRAPRVPRPRSKGPPARRAASAKKPAPAEPIQKRERIPRKPGALDQLMTALATSEGKQILVPLDEEARYRQLAGSAKRFARIPENMRLAFEYEQSAEEAMLRISLESIPAWQAAVLESVQALDELRNPSDVVEEFIDSETFTVTGAPRNRALLLLDALVAGGRELGMTVEARPNEPIRRSGYDSAGPRRDEVSFRVGGDEFRLWFTQAKLKVSHEPTARELARARQGFLFPDVDIVPDENVGISLDGQGRTFWADRWADNEEHRLEEDLAQILEEIRLRHMRLVRQRKQEQQRQQQRRQHWEAAREQAIAKYRQQFLIKAMESQAERWAQASRLRQYAQAVRDQGKLWDGDERVSAVEWAAQIEERAAKIDPLPRAGRFPKIPAPKPEDLGPFMGSWSDYGP